MFLIGSSGKHKEVQIGLVAIWLHGTIKNNQIAHRSRWVFLGYVVTFVLKIKKSILITAKPTK